MDTEKQVELNTVTAKYLIEFADKLNSGEYNIVGMETKCNKTEATKQEDSVRSFNVANPFEIKVTYNKTELD